MRAPISDYGKFFLSSTEYSEIRPESESQAIQIVRDALSSNTTLRIRGSGHSLSGMTLPRAGELLLRTDALRQYRFETDHTITVGAGAVMWDIRDFVEQFGASLPVYNGGWAGPTLGGYVNAGGMGLRVPPQEQERAKAAQPAEAGAQELVSISEVHGGFWEQVHRIRIVDGSGLVHDITEEDPRFPWLFASCGQFGLILEAELKLISNTTAPLALPTGQSGDIPLQNETDPLETNGLAPGTGMSWIYWFSYLVPLDREAEAWDFVDEWAKRHREILRPSGGWVGPVHDGAPIGFRYLVRHKRFTPPLLYPDPGDFLLMGVMACCEGIGLDQQEEKLKAAEVEFVEQAQARGWSLYAQAENLTRSLNYHDYLGPDRYGYFQKLKAEFDPKGLINPGEIFDQESEPVRTTVIRQLARAKSLLGLTKAKR